MNPRCIIITGQQSEPLPLDIGLAEADLVLAADAGFYCAINRGVTPDIIIGDFDSLADIPDEYQNIETIKLDREKDRTDTMACVMYGIEKGYDNFVIYGGMSGRLGHTFANLQTLSFLTDLGCSAWIIDGANRATMLDGIKKNMYEYLNAVDGDDEDSHYLELAPMPEHVFSVFSFEEVSSGVYIKDAKYELDDATLTNAWPIGVSNEFIGGKKAKISVKRGRLLITMERLSCMS